jgi:hypothetical protein
MPRCFVPGTMLKMPPPQGPEIDRTTGRPWAGRPPRDAVRRRGLEADPFNDVASDCSSVPRCGGDSDAAT